MTIRIEKYHRPLAILIVKYKERTLMIAIITYYNALALPPYAISSLIGLYHVNSENLPLMIYE